MKKLIRSLHLFLGLLSGLVVLIVSVTGCLYAFEEQFRNLLHKELLHVEAQAAPMLSPGELMKAARAAFPKPAVKNIRLKPADKTASAEIILKNKQSVYVDPYSGKVLGSYNKDSDFFGTVQKIHRHLYLGDPGKIITGTSALIFVCMLITGVVLWWPQKRAVKGSFSIKWNALWPKRLLDLHKVLGFYASWIIIFTAVTGLIWSFKWVENTFYALAGSKKEEVRLKSKKEEQLSAYPVDKIYLMADSAYPGAQEVFVTLPEDSNGVYKVSLRYGREGFFMKQHQLVFDQYSGKNLRTQLFSAASAGDKMKSLNYDIHTGKLLGIPGQVLVFFAALISASLPVTGFLLWRQRRKIEKGTTTS